MSRLAAVPLALCVLLVAGCKSEGSGGLVDAAVSGDSGAVKGAATDSAKSEATAQAEAELAKATQGAQAGTAAQAGQAGQMPSAVPPTQGTLTRTTPSSNYPSKTCVVTGEQLPPAPQAFLWQGREVQFCCPRCASDFLKDPATYLARLDAAR